MMSGLEELITPQLLAALRQLADAGLLTTLMASLAHGNHAGPPPKGSGKGKGKGDGEYLTVPESLAESWRPSNRHELE